VDLSPNNNQQGGPKKAHGNHRAYNIFSFD
jgi:hypothetical protein